MRQALSAVLLAASCLVSCGGPGANGPGRALPPYTGRAVELFDDGIDPSAVSYQLDPGPPPATDVALRARVQAADAVFRARVVTVTAKREDAGRSWQIGLKLVKRLGGPIVPTDDLTLDVDASDPGAGMVKAFGAKLVGQTIVVCMRSFVGAVPPGAAGAPPEEDLHFHVLADRPDVLAAIAQIALLQQVR